MLNNDILRSLRFTLDLPDHKVSQMIEKGGLDPAALNIKGFLTAEGEVGYQSCHDKVLSAFLDGLIVEKRGPREPSATPAPVLKFDNNLILKKLRVAFELKQEDVQALMASAGLLVTATELGALFRKPDHKHYRQCKDQFLRALLKGLVLKYRPNTQSN